jgi:hypothetical protein
MLRSVSKSFWSFLDSQDIQQAFTFTDWGWTPESNGYKETKVPSDGFVDTFMDLVFYITLVRQELRLRWNGIRTFPATFLMVNLRFSRLLLICRETFH